MAIRRRVGFRSRLIVLLIVVCAIGCAAPEAFDEDVAGGSGGAGARPTGPIVHGTGGTHPGTGGSPVGSGGAGSGGSSSGSGGAIAAGSGGTGSGGSSSGTGGAIATGSGGASLGSGGASAGTGGTSIGTGGTGAANGVVFADDFETGNARRWSELSSNDWSVISDGAGHVYREGTLTNFLRMSLADGGAWTDQTVEARVKVLAFGGTSTSALAAVCVRARDAEHFYYLALRSDGRMAIRLKTPSTSATIDSAFDAGLATDTWYTVKLRAQGSTLSAYLNGTLMKTVTDTTLSSGSVAVLTSSATAVFDDVVVTVP